MSLLRTVIEKRAINIPKEWFKGWGWDTASGLTVTPEDALKLSAVWACVRILAETVASLPLVIYRRRADGGKERATNHPLYRVLHDQANDEMTSFQWREVGMTHLATWGNLYSQIIMNKAGQVIGLYPLFPDRMTVTRNENDELVYEYRLMRPDKKGNQKKTFKRAQILHIPGLGYNGVVGYSPIAMARQAVGLGLAAEEFGARFFGNGARPGGVIESPKDLTDAAYKRFRDRWNETHRGLDNSHGVAILEDGMKYVSIGIPPEDAQFLETRKFQVSEIARIFRVPPHMLADLDRATFSNIEHQSIEFVVHTIRPWLVRWEQMFNMTLLTEAERDGYFVEFLVDGLLRGDMQARYQAYQVARQNGWMSVNEIRGLENMNPIDGGDEYLVPLNMTPAAENDEGNATTENEEDNEERNKPVVNGLAMEAIADVLQEALRRVFKREAQDIQARLRKFRSSPGDGEANELSAWLTRWYPEHNEWATEQLSAPMRAFWLLTGYVGEEELQSLVTRMVEGIEAETMTRLQGALEMGDEVRLDELIDERAEGWMGWMHKKLPVDQEKHGSREYDSIGRVAPVQVTIPEIRMEMPSEVRMEMPAELQELLRSIVALQKRDVRMEMPAELREYLLRAMEGDGVTMIDLPADVKELLRQAVNKETVVNVAPAQVNVTPEITVKREEGPTAWVIEKGADGKPKKIRKE